MPHRLWQNCACKTEHRADKGQQVKGGQGEASYESHLWDSFLYAAADADFAGPAVTLRCPDIL